MVRRIATLALSAAALLAISPLITSCGTPHAGAAAIVGGQTISETALQEQVKAVRTAQNGAPQATQLIAATSDLNRVLLGTMVSDDVLDRAVSDAGLTVTRRDAQQLRALAEQQLGGPTTLQEYLLQRDDVAPGSINAFFRFQAEVQALARHLGANLSTPAGNQVVIQALVRTARELRVDINPRYGTWNAQTLSLGPAQQPWERVVVPVVTAMPADAQG